MNVPYVKVNNLEEFKRVVAKMERETGLNANACGHIFYPSIVGGDVCYRAEIFHDIDDVENYISAYEYLTGIRENFTLDDLENGTVVEYRNGGKRLFMYNSFIGTDSYGDIENYNDNFSHNQDFFELDIVKIYKLHSFKDGFDGLFDERNLILIFNAEAHRNKSKVLQRKSEIENEIKKLQEELNNLWNY